MFLTFICVDQQKAYWKVSDSILHNNYLSIQKQSATASTFLKHKIIDEFSIQLTTYFEMTNNSTLL